MMKLVAALLHQSCSPEALLLIGVEKNITATASSQYNYSRENESCDAFV